MITLQWHGETPETNHDELELAVLTDIKRSLGSLDKPSDLVFHTVFLGKDMDGPNVMVWGEDNDDDHFHCQYYTDAEWVTLDGEPANV
jgi:hypothetical protein